MEKLYDLDFDEGPPVLRLVRDAPTGGYQLRDELACVGHLRIGRWPGMQAVFADDITWSFDSVRQGRRSTVGVAWESRSGAAIAGFYPGFWRPGGQIAFQATSYRLSAPLVRLGWRLRDEDDALLAVISARPHQRTSTRRLQTALPDELTLTLHEPACQQPTRLVGLLLFCVWAVLISPTGISAGL